MESSTQSPADRVKKSGNNLSQTSSVYLTGSFQLDVYTCPPKAPIYSQ